ncbi:hypothetical protein F5Y00DRAFT_264426 [Daldinia vernicosa]|uniref:uncharacterized protein n=1 Tax=Daldinia vernicosa TaxID=114800 RepID=UPI0020078EE4|nr:uncharacterized protein F5Y00DRAFT_264426 [Daldinia vernicosa]KAI0846613.1 hypothetical protein F5Y00DRAFT_264426 [Daldinia vernicosa]
MPVIDTEALAESVIEVPEPVETPTESEVTEYSVADLDGDIYDDEPTVAPSKPVELNTDSLTAVDIFGGIEPEKTFARYELVDFSEEDTVAVMAARRVERLAASLEPVLARLDMLSIG